jgi:hypothetical protein
MIRHTLKKKDYIKIFCYGQLTTFFFITAATFNGHNFERRPSKDHPTQIWFNLVQLFKGEDLNVKVYDVQWTQNNCETALPNEPTLGRKHLWKVLHKVSSKQNER